MAKTRSKGKARAVSPRLASARRASARRASIRASSERAPIEGTGIIRKLGSNREGSKWIGMA